MTRILLCHNTAKTLFLHYEQLIHSLLERGYDVICVTPEDDAVPSLLALGAKHRTWNVSQYGINPWKEFLAWRQLSKLIKEISPNIFFSITIKPNLYGAFALIGSAVPKRFHLFSGLGYVFTGNSIKHKILRFFVKQIIKVTFRSANGVFFLNQDDAGEFVSSGMVTNTQVIAINGTGIDTQVFQQKEYSDESNIKFLFVGRIVGDKGVFEFVEAARQLVKHYGNATFSLLGPLDNNYPMAIQANEIKQWEKQGIIHYLGVTSDVKPYLLAADVFVLPSYREGLSRATLEAMAMGLPIITTDAPGCKQAVSHGVTGYIVQNQDAAALAEAMESFISNRQLATEMGKRSRKKAVDEFDVHQVIKTIIAPLERVGKLY